MIAVKTFVAGGSLTANTLVRYDLSSATVVTATSVSDRILGVYIGPGPASATDEVDVCMLGQCQLVVSGSVGRGAPLTTNASGNGVFANPAPGTTNTVAAIALEPSSGGTIPVFVVPSRIHGAPLTGTATLNFPSIAAGAVETLTITVTGAAPGDSVALGPPAAMDAGLIWSGYVSATNTVTVRLYNSTGSPIDPPSAAWRATVVR